MLLPKSDWQQVLRFFSPLCPQAWTQTCPPCWCGWPRTDPSDTFLWARTSTTSSQSEHAGGGDRTDVFCLELEESCNGFGLARVWLGSSSAWHLRSVFFLLWILQSFVRSVFLGQNMNTPGWTVGFDPQPPHCWNLNPVVADGCAVSTCPQLDFRD